MERWRYWNPGASNESQHLSRPHPPCLSPSSPCSLSSSLCLSSYISLSPSLCSKPLFQRHADRQIGPEGFFVTVYADASMDIDKYSLLQGERPNVVLPELHLTYCVLVGNCKESGDAAFEANACMSANMLLLSQHTS